jgi:hypothetical protein
VNRPGPVQNGIAVILLLLSADHAQAQTPVPTRIIEWVENAPMADTNRIALGYPVPIPVDTPIPFDGFRSYAGLHTRHQDLMGGSDYIHGEVAAFMRANGKRRKSLPASWNCCMSSRPMITCSVTCAITSM